jgi:hypothetical protein
MLAWVLELVLVLKASGLPYCLRSRRQLFFAFHNERAPVKGALRLA